MTYEIIEVTDEENVFNHIVITRADGSFESFPVDDNNPRYQQWLKAGNEPEVIEYGTPDETE